MTGPLKITAWLASPLAGNPPQLDALMEWSLSPFEQAFARQQARGNPHFHIDRSLPAPKHGTIRIPLYREWLGKHLVARCSNPILPTARVDAVDHINKRIAVEASGLLRDDERKVIATTNSWTKSYRLPLRVRAVDRVVWFACGNRRNVNKSLQDVQAVGKKVADGYGRVKEWLVEDIDADYSWFAPTESGYALMRILPIGDWLPSELVGAKKHFGACCPPYWHPERFAEIVVPC